MIMLELMDPRILGFHIRIIHNRRPLIVLCIKDVILEIQGTPFQPAQAMRKIFINGAGKNN